MYISVCKLCGGGGVAHVVAKKLLHEKGRLSILPSCSWFTLDVQFLVDFCLAGPWWKTLGIFWRKGGRPGGLKRGRTFLPGSVASSQEARSTMALVQLRRCRFFLVGRRASRNGVVMWLWVKKKSPRGFSAGAMVYFFLLAKGFFRVAGSHLTHSLVVFGWENPKSNAWES